MKALLILITLIITGCASAGPIDMITPTIVPPLSEELGFDIPDLFGVTTVGIVMGTLEKEKLRLMALDKSASMTLAATNEVKGGVMDIIALLGLGGTAMLPVAAKKLPKGAKWESDK